MLKNRFGTVRASSLRFNSIFQLLLLGGVALSIGAVGHHMQGSGLRSLPAAAIANSTALPVAVSQTVQTVVSSAPARALTSASKAVAQAIAPRPQIATREVELESGQNLTALLTDAGVAPPDALAAASALGKVYDLRHLLAGQNLTLFFTATGQQQDLSRIVFQPEATKEITIARNAQGDFTASSASIPVTRQRLAAAGEIQSSLFDAGAKAGVPYAIMASLMRVYSHDVDFQRDVHSGDHFEVLYEQPTTSKGTAVGEGSIIYASLKIGGQSKPVYRVTFNDGTIDYFDERGQSIRRTLLRTPVAAAHITSGFGMRMHPILGYSKMHQGVDFGAPTGTPIFAAGNGIVTEIGTKGGYGRYIRVRHNGQLETAYAHMSRYAQGLYRGAHVTQGEVIGYVGMSGRATGPHLHFEVHVAGRPVNPLSVDLPTGRALDGKLLTAFKQGQTHVKQEFASLLTKNPAFTPASASGPAFASVRQALSCGLRGGC